MYTSWIYLKGDSPSRHASCHQEASMPTINDRHVSAAVPNAKPDLSEF